MDAIIIKLWNEGKGFREIAAYLMTTVGTVAGRKHRMEKAGYKFEKRVSPIVAQRKPSPPKPGVDYMANVNGCRAILDQRSGPYQLPMVCGLPRCTDSAGRDCSYCQAHYTQFNYVSHSRVRSYYG